MDDGMCDGPLLSAFVVALLLCGLLTDAQRGGSRPRPSPRIMRDGSFASDAVSGCPYTRQTDYR